MQLKVDDRTKEMLVELAGGPRKLGEYLDQIVPDIYAAQARIKRAEREARQRAIAISIIEKETEEDQADA